MRVKLLNWDHIQFCGLMEVWDSKEFSGFLEVQVLETTNRTNGMHGVFEPLLTHSSRGQRDNVTTLEGGTNFVLNKSQVLFMVPTEEEE